MVNKYLPGWYLLKIISPPTGYLVTCTLKGDIKIENNTGVILEINSETDFVAKNENFQEFCETISSLCAKNNINELKTTKYIIDKSLGREANLY